MPLAPVAGGSPSHYSQKNNQEELKCVAPGCFCNCVP